MTYGEFSEKCLALCARHGCSTTSGVRTKKRNQAVGGKQTSKHLLERHDDGTGYAVDLVPDDNLSGVRTLVIADAHDMGLGALDEGDHIHVQFPPKGANP